MRTLSRALLRWRILLAVALASMFAAVGAADVPVLKKIGEHHLLTRRQGAAAVAHGGYIYVFGGLNDGGPLSDVERFDPRTNKSEQVFDQLVPRRYHRAVEYRGRAYLFGGIGAGARTQAYESAVEIFDLSRKTVTRGPNMQVARAHFALGRVGDRFLLTGGARLKDGGGVIQTNETSVYDPGTNTWAKGVPMPTPREAFGVVADGMFFVPGGYRGNKARTEIECLVPQENNWKALPPLPRPISAHSIALLDKYLFIFGDYLNVGSVLAYDLNARSATDVRTDFKGVRHSVAVVHADRIYVIGGNTGDDRGVSDLVQVFALQK